MRPSASFYVGTRRSAFGVIVRRVDMPGESGGADVRPLEHKMYHSPDGFEWGYAGSGPSDLARSIMFDFLKDDPSIDPLRIYQDFKFAFIAVAPKLEWVLSFEEIGWWVQEWRAQHRDSLSPAAAE